MCASTAQHSATTHAAERHNSNTFVCVLEVKKIHTTGRQKVCSEQCLGTKNGRELNCTALCFEDVLTAQVRSVNMFVSPAQKDSSFARSTGHVTGLMKTDGITHQLSSAASKLNNTQSFLRISRYVGMVCRYVGGFLLHKSSAKKIQTGCP